MRRAVAEVARPLSGLRRVEFVRRGDGAARRGARGAAPALGGGGSRLYADVDTVVAERIATGHQRVRSRARRRHRAGIARAARRRAGHRQVDAAAAGRRALRRARRAGAVLLGRGIRAPDQDARRAARRRPTRRCTCWRRRASSGCSRKSIALKPALLIVDSIQTVFSLKMQSAPGSVGQVRQAATDLLFTAKGRNLPTILVGHVTKDGSLAGPKVLEHVVDTVLYFEGAAASRASRRARGEEPVRRGQRARRVRDDRRRPAAGAESVAAVPGRAADERARARRCCARSKARGRSSSRCRRSSARRRSATPRRTASGLDQNRLSLLLAVLDKRAGLNLATDDVFVNVAGGMTVDEPAADLADRRPPSPRACATAPFRPTSSSSARSAWPAKCARRRRRRCACAKPASSASRAASCPRAVSRPRDVPDRARDRRRPHGRRGARRPDVGSRRCHACTGFVLVARPSSWRRSSSTSATVDRADRRASRLPARCSGLAVALLIVAGRERGCATRAVTQPARRPARVWRRPVARAARSSAALFWAEHDATRKVQFLHGLIVVVLPYLGHDARRAQGRVARAGQVRVALQGRAAAEALQDPRHQRHHRRPHRRHRRDRVPRRHARRAAVRAEGTAVRRRLVRSAQAQPRPARPRHPAAHPEDGRRRGA